MSGTSSDIEDSRNTQATLAQCLLLAFEKSLNVHFLQQTKKLSTQAQS
jgi:hypothetical protein